MSESIQLSRGVVALVDSRDFEVLNAHKWTYDPTTGYAYRREMVAGVYKKIYMHREIMGPAPSRQVDHIDRDGLNNHRVNLRVCSRSDNQHNRGTNKTNTSGYKNVFKVKNSYQVNIMLNYRQYRKNFKDLARAIVYRDKLIKQLHGEFARTEAS